MTSWGVFLRVQLCRLDVVAAFSERWKLERSAETENLCFEDVIFSHSSDYICCDNLAQVLSFRMIQVSAEHFYINSGVIKPPVR
jgi:hypothetical protein